MYKHHTKTEIQSMADRAAELHNRIIGAGPDDADRRYYIVYSAPDPAGPGCVGFYLKERVLNPDYFVYDAGGAVEVARGQTLLVAPGPAARRFGSYEDPVSLAELHAYLSGLISALESHAADVRLATA